MITYFSILIPLVLLDAVWLSLIAKSFYQKELSHLFADSFTYWPAILFYLLYAFGIMFFVVNPNLSGGSIMNVLLQGALLGLVAYGAYDFTNHATLEKWPLIITVVDLIWGAAVTALAGVIAYLFVK